MEKLPIVRRKREASKTPDILEKIMTTCAVEVKQTKTDTLPANSVKPHQRDNLLKAKHRKFHYKIPDYGRQNPFDAVILYLTDAYIVVIYGDNTTVMIDIDHFPPIDKPLTKEKALSLGKILK